MEKFCVFNKCDRKHQKKDYGNYKDFFVDGLKIKTNYLILGTGAPRYQKSILDSETVNSLIAWDSKDVYYRSEIETIHDFLSKLIYFLQNFKNGINQKMY